MYMHMYIPALCIDCMHSMQCYACMGANLNGGKSKSKRTKPNHLTTPIAANPFDSYAIIPVAALPNLGWKRRICRHQL